MEAHADHCSGTGDDFNGAGGVGGRFQRGHAPKRLEFRVVPAGLETEGDHALACGGQSLSDFDEARGRFALTLAGGDHHQILVSRDASFGAEQQRGVAAELRPHAQPLEQPLRIGVADNRGHTAQASSDPSFTCWAERADALVENRDALTEESRQTNQRQVIRQRAARGFVLQQAAAAGQQRVRAEQRGQ